MPFKFDFGGAGTTTTVYGYFTASLDITVAALSGGAQIAPATGTLPQRLTTETDKFIIFDAAGSTRTGIAPHPTSGSVFFTVSRNAPRRILRVDLAVGTTGAYTTFVTGSTTDPTRNALSSPETCTPGFDNRIWFIDAAAPFGIGFVDAATGRCEKFIIPDVPGPGTASHVVEHMAGKLLARTSSSTSANYIEYSFGGTGSSNFVTYTGRQMTDTAFFDAIPDMSGNIYTLEATSTNIRKRSCATLSQSAIFTSPNTLWTTGLGYSNAYRMGAYNQNSARLHVNRGTGVSDMLNVVDMTMVGRSFNNMDMGNPPTVQSSTYWRNPVAWSADGSYAAMLALIPDVGSSVNILGAVRGIRMGVQRARWNWTPSGSDRMLHTIVFDGQVNNSRDFLSSRSTGTDYWFHTEQSYRRTRFYYSFDGGTNAIEFLSGEMLNLNISVTSTLTIDCQFQWNASNHFGVPPYITSGTIIYI